MKYTLLSEENLKGVFGQNAHFDFESNKGIMPVFDTVEEYIRYRDLLTKPEFEQKLQEKVALFAESSGMDPQNIRDGLILKIKRQLNQELGAEIADNRLSMLCDALENDDELKECLVVASECPNIYERNGFYPVVHALISNLEAARQIGNEVIRSGSFIKGIHLDYADGRSANLFSRNICIYDSNGNVVRRAKQNYKERPEEGSDESQKQ